MFSLPSFAVVLVASLWTVIAQPLSSFQYSALMVVYNGFGSFLSHHHPVCNLIFFFFFIFFFIFHFHRMQHNHMSSIRFD
jgi:hypothetical protein